MEKLAYIVDRLNMPPFNKGFTTMTEFDSKSNSDLIEITSDIIVAIDADQEPIYKEPMEFKVARMVQFLLVMKFNIPEDQLQDFESLLLAGDKEILHTIMHWCLQRFETLQKRAYLAKFLMPLDIPAEFMNEELVIELSGHLKELQAEFKEVHKLAEKAQNNGSRPAELKAEISQLEQEKTQLQNKISRMKKDSQTDEAYFREMLKVTSQLRKEQEEEVRTHERLREHRRALQEVDQRLSETTKRLQNMRSSGVQNQSAEQLLNKLQREVRELSDRREQVENTIADREAHLDKLQGWDSSDRVTTEDDVRAKRDQVHDMEDQLASLQQRLDDALERNPKLVVFRQASAMAMKKLREKEQEQEKLQDDKRRLGKQLAEKEAQQAAQFGRGGAPKLGKRELQKYQALVRDKIEKYKKMREMLASMRSELVTLQRTEQILKSRTRDLDDFMQELERKNGVVVSKCVSTCIVEIYISLI